MTRETYIVCPVEDLDNITAARLYSGFPSLDLALELYEKNMRNPIVVPRDGGGFNELKWVIVKCNITMERVKPLP